jgi:UDP-N-acetylglucosamine diphosphorylase/glucosamine-1-phosphate N-acetyltransferase
MDIILFDHPGLRTALLPFTYTRPVAALRVGICTLAEKWRQVTGAEVSYHTEPYLTEKFPRKSSSDALYVNGALMADGAIAAAVTGLRPGEVLVSDDELPLAFRVSGNPAAGLLEGHIPAGLPRRPVGRPARLIRRPTDIFLFNGDEIRHDFRRLTGGRTSQPVDDRHTAVYGDQLFVESGVRIRAAVLNCENGPIYLGKGSEVGEGSVIRGPFSLGAGSVLNLGARIRGDNSIGPGCKVGGELTNSVFLANSSKAHDGYLGNSVIGEWCNIGAGSSASNLKNNFSNARLWHYGLNARADTGLLFCGLMLGDYSRCAVNTSFNTGTVAGVAANIFGNGMPPTHLPSFSWGGDVPPETWQIDRFLETAERMWARRNEAFPEVDKRILCHIFELTKSQRGVF